MQILKKIMLSMLIVCGVGSVAFGMIDVQALHEAAMQRNADRISELLRLAGENAVNATNCDGVTALHQAAFHGHAECLKRLIEFGANVNAVTNRSCFILGPTALHFAAGQGHAECIEILCRAGAKVNEKDPNGLTPLHRAAAKGHLDCIKKLIEFGANLNRSSSR
jgi:ankyrin repeat protein